MPILGERFYQMSNAIFCYDLKPDPAGGIQLSGLLRRAERTLLAQHQDHRTAAVRKTLRGTQSGN